MIKWIDFLLEMLKKLLEHLKKFFQPSNSITNKNTVMNKTSVKIEQNKNNGTITNNIGVKPTAEKNDEGDYTLNYDNPEV